MATPAPRPRPTQLVAPDREQGVGVAGVFDPAHDQPGGDLIPGAGEGGVGHFGANSAWALCAAIAHNLLHATGTLARGRHARARGATLRRHIIAVPARLARPARTPVLHLPSHWPWAPGWLQLWEQTIGPSLPAAA